jgi:hypothetical protein
VEQVLLTSCAIRRQTMFRPVELRLGSVTCSAGRCDGGARDTLFGHGEAEASLAGAEFATDDYSDSCRCCSGVTDREHGGTDIRGARYDSCFKSCKIQQQEVRKIRPSDAKRGGQLHHNSSVAGFGGGSSGSGGCCLSAAASHAHMACRCYRAIALPCHILSCRCCSANALWLPHSQPGLERRM